MPPLPAPMRTVVRARAALFSARVWSHAQVLVMGTTLAPAQRTVAATVRLTSLAQMRQVHRSHCVLSRVVRSQWPVGRVRFGLLVTAFAPTGPLRWSRWPTHWPSIRANSSAARRMA
jgi:hypothetical protein